MSIRFKCPHCGRQMKANENLAGKELPCPKCTRTFTIPDAKQASLQEKPSHVLGIILIVIVALTGVFTFLSLRKKAEHESLREQPAAVEEPAAKASRSGSGRSLDSLLRAEGDGNIQAKLDGIQVSLRSMKYEGTKTKIGTWLPDHGFGFLSISLTVTSDANKPLVYDTSHMSLEATDGKLYPVHLIRSAASPDQVESGVTSHKVTLEGLSAKDERDFVFMIPENADYARYRLKYDP